MNKFFQSCAGFRRALTAIGVMLVIIAAALSAGCGNMFGGRGGSHKVVPTPPPAQCVNTFAKAARLSVDVKKNLIDMPELFSDEDVVEIVEDKKDDPGKKD